MRELRFRTAIVAAACAHAVAVAAVHHARARSSPAIAPDAAELIVIAMDPVPEPAPATATLREPVAAPVPAREQPTAARGAAKLRVPTDASPSSDPAAAVAILAAPAPSASASNDGWSLPAPPLQGQGLPGLSTDGYWKAVAMAPSTGATGERESPSAALQRGLREELDAHDQDLGLGSSGPLVAAAHDAASGTSAPDVGSAVFEIECDASGRVVLARADSAGAELAGWESVARELVRLMASKTVRVPPGARGVRMRLAVAVERTLPGGERREVTPGAAPAGACTGTGLTRRCGAGLPLGASGTLGDLSNIGAKRSRVVHVQVLDELAIR